jgi:outer membrane protein insertion porin family
MNPKALLFAALLLFCALPAFAQKKPAASAQRKTPSKSIRFQGAPQYAQDELLAAAGLKPDARLSASEIKVHARQLNDTGFFAAIKFTADSKGLLFTLMPVSQLFPIHLDNLPLAPGKDLDDALHARFPLYRGQVPASGSVLEGIRQSLEQMLAAQGLKATVKAEVTSGLGPKKITAMNFTITSPTVRIGQIQLSGVSAAMQAKANALVAAQTGNDFDTENTAIGLQHAFADLYQDQGYAAVEVAVTRIAPAIVTDQSAAIPFSVAIKEGGIYTLGAINYPAGALIARAEVQKALAKYPASAGRPLDLFISAVRDAYRARGYLDCAIDSHPAFNEATHIVNYNLGVTAGPLYQMGAVQFDGAPDPMAQKLTRLWKLAPGATFDESYVSSFAARTQKQDRALNKWLQTVIANYDEKPDPATHTVNVILHFAKPAQSGRN